MTIVRVVRLVVHHKLLVYKVEAVRARLERVLHHLIDRLLGQPGKLVNMLTAVQTVRDAKAKVKVECFEMLISKKVSLDHPEVGDRLPSDFKLYGGANRSEFQKLQKFVKSLTTLYFPDLRCKLVSDESPSVEINHPSVL